MTFRILAQFYPHPRLDVMDFIRRSILANAALDFVDEILLAYEGNAASPPIHPKIKYFPVGNRVNYAWMLELMSDVNPIRDGLTCIINSDIVLGESVGLLSNAIKSNNTVVALSRYESDGTLCSHPQWSQDCWIFKSHQVSRAVLKRSEYDLGVAGCENMFAMSLFIHGYRIWNPCMDVRVNHSDPDPQIFFKHRYYGSYLFLPPCRIADVEINSPQYQSMIKVYDDKSPELPYPE